MALATLVSLAANAQAVSETDANWEVQVDADGVLVETRDVEGSNYKAFRASATVSASPAEVMARLRDFAEYPNWFPDTLEARRLERDDGVFASYVRTDAPWPVKDRDAVYRQTTEETADRIVISIVAMPDAVPEVKGAVRVREASGAWILTAIDDNRTRIEWEFHLEPGGNVPASLANARVIETPEKALTALQEYFPAK